MNDYISVKKLKKQQFTYISLINLFIILFAYIVVPLALNYPPFISRDLKFQGETEILNYPIQYLIFWVISTAFFYIIINSLMKNIYLYLRKKENNEKISEKYLTEIRKNCINIPYIFYFSEVAIILILALFIIVSLGINFSNTLVIRASLLFFTLISFISILQLIFLQRSLKNIIISTYTSVPPKSTAIRIKFSSNLILQLIPFLISSFIIISLIGYSKTTTEKGNSISNYYKVYLKHQDLNTVSVDELKNHLDNIPLYSESDYYIILPPNKINIYTSNNTEVSEFFLKYLDYYFDISSGKIYEHYSTEKQAYMIKLLDENSEPWYIGFEYSITDFELMRFFIIVIFLISIMYISFIYIWSRNTSTRISEISESLEYISKENDYTSKKYLPIVSNDEFGDLAYSYNKIEELTNQYLKELQDKQDILIEQERLASLGQMIGGIAHNLKTPIFSVSGGLEGLSDLVDEFDLSIENNQVTPQDMHEIASEMHEWLNKLKGHISYMSDVITTVKGQTVALSNSTAINFSITEVFKRVDILMKHEVQNALAILTITNNVGDNEILSGNINSLVQIINNIISNALEAYNNKYEKKLVELYADISGNKVIITIKDYGPGIPKRVQRKLFKEMITTKGKNGTGLGMFMSYSNIKAHFNGKLSFETEIDKGTSFFITLPLKNN